MKIDTTFANTKPTGTASSHTTVSERFAAALEAASADTMIPSVSMESSGRAAPARTKLAASSASDTQTAAAAPKTYNLVSPTPLTVIPTSELAAILLGLPMVSAGGPGNTTYRCSDHLRDSAFARNAAWEAAGCPAVDADGKTLDNRGEAIPPPSKP